MRLNETHIRLSSGSGPGPNHPSLPSIEAAYPGYQRFFALPFLALQLHSQPHHRRFFYFRVNSAGNFLIQFFVFRPTVWGTVAWPNGRHPAAPETTCRVYLPFFDWLWVRARWKNVQRQCRVPSIHPAGLPATPAPSNHPTISNSLPHAPKSLFCVLLIFSWPRICFHLRFCIALCQRCSPIFSFSPPPTIGGGWGGGCENNARVSVHWKLVKNDANEEAEPRSMHGGGHRIRIRNRQRHLKPHTRALKPKNPTCHPTPPKSPLPTHMSWLGVVPGSAVHFYYFDHYRVWFVALVSSHGCCSRWWWCCCCCCCRCSCLAVCSSPAD